MFLRWKEKRWAGSGWQICTCSLGRMCLHLPRRWNPFYHNLGAERGSYENYSSTSCRRIVTQKRRDGLQVGPSFIHRGEIAYWLQSVRVCECMFTSMCRGVCVCVCVCVCWLEHVASFDDEPKKRVRESRKQKIRVQRDIEASVSRASQSWIFSPLYSPIFTDHGVISCEIHLLMYRNAFLIMCSSVKKI